MEPPRGWECQRYLLTTSGETQNCLCGKDDGTFVFQVELEVLLWKILCVLLQFFTFGSCCYLVILCQLVVEGVLVFGASSPPSPQHSLLQEVSTLATSLEDGLLVAVGSSAKGTRLLFVAVLTHFWASAKRVSGLVLFLPSPSSFAACFVVLV